mmetsp:Transcript_30269/g.65424  ORF Transcript_30269/g.65424 Transcript_30269/m.65424 type:complete len:361 (-) Transcript_30269:277-1359(-)
MARADRGDGHDERRVADPRRLREACATHAAGDQGGRVRSGLAKAGARDGDGVDAGAARLGGGVGRGDGVHGRGVDGEAQREGCGAQRRHGQVRRVAMGAAEGRARARVDEQGVLAAGEGRHLDPSRRVCDPLHSLEVGRSDAAAGARLVDAVVGAGQRHRRRARGGRVERVRARRPGLVEGEEEAQRRVAPTGRGDGRGADVGPAAGGLCNHGGLGVPVGHLDVGVARPHLLRVVGQTKATPRKRHAQRPRVGCVADDEGADGVGRVEAEDLGDGATVSGEGRVHAEADGQPRGDLDDDARVRGPACGGAARVAEAEGARGVVLVERRRRDGERRPARHGGVAGEQRAVGEEERVERHGH